MADRAAARRKKEDDKLKRKADRKAAFHNRKDDRLKKKAFKSSRQNKLTNFFKEFQGMSLLDEKRSSQNDILARPVSLFNEKRELQPEWDYL